MSAAVQSFSMREIGNATYGVNLEWTSLVFQFDCFATIVWKNVTKLCVSFCNDLIMLYMKRTLYWEHYVMFSFNSVTPKLLLVFKIKSTVNCNHKNMLYVIASFQRKKSITSSYQTKVMRFSMPAHAGLLVLKKSITSSDPSSCKWELDSLRNVVVENERDFPQAWINCMQL
ncbi:hypothetical protein T01_3715 [Trichinella spiralis]|uniref:Uncharacterized protein n=1 Tax=Trichinella spiralis TaxID=6334 RepID=A0A0V1APT4_TRISP|nr:hypothetical protein T01_3715 [Trichinella spiralis]